MRRSHPRHEGGDMTECYCDYDAPVFYTAKCVKARKPHKCGECGRGIAAGEIYEKAIGKMDDGYIYTPKTCSHCRDIRQFVQNSVPCFCWAHGSLDDDVSNAVQDAYYRARDEVKGLAFAVGRLMVKRDRTKRAMKSSP
jgi:hypothetical protein